MADFATQAQQIRNIWAGDWQARLSSYSKTLPQTFTAAEEKEFYRLGGVGQGVYKSYVNPSALPNEYIPAGKLYAYWQILRARADKSQSTAASSKAAGSAAAAAARAQAAAEKSAQAATVAKQSGEKAAKSAAIAERARADYERQKSAVASEAVKQSSASAGKGAGIAAKSAQEYEDMKAALKEKQVRYLDADVQAKHDEEQAQIDKAKLEARIAQEQAAREAAEERAANAEANQIIYTYSDTTTPYYSSGENMDNNLTLQPVAVQGTNLRNSLLIVGGVAFVWWLFKKRKRGR